MTDQANFLQSLGWAVLNSLWQLSLLLIIYHAITGVFQTAKSSVKSSLASAFLIGGFAWFFYTFFSAYVNNSNSTVISSFFITVEGNQQVNELLQQTLAVASVIYLVLLVLPLLRFVRNYRYVQIIRKYGLTKINVEWRLFVNKITGHIDIRKKVQIWVSEFVSSPVTIGFLKPIILVPLAAINHLTPQQLEAVLLHELSHIKRFDYLINLIINIIHTILYFNPFVKTFIQIIEREREKSCDEMVLQFQYDSHEYATALLTLEKAHHKNKQFAVAATGKKNDLLHRIELIMGINKKTIFSFNKLASLMGCLLCVIAINALLLFNTSVNNGGAAISFAHITSPFNFTQSGVPTAKNITKEIEQPFAVINHAKQETNTFSTPSFADYVTASISPELINASLELANNPELKKYQEEQVERTMKASKKILESVQWKEVEKSIADVFSQGEKDELKANYEKEMEKFDWKKWENNLKLAYDNIDWEKINIQLSTAVNQIRLDSIQLVYNKAISKLDGVRKELSLHNMKGVPDSDITLKEIERKKADIQRALTELKTVRRKKIVHL